MKWEEHCILAETLPQGRHRKSQHPDVFALKNLSIFNDDDLQRENRQSGTALDTVMTKQELKLPAMGFTGQLWQAYANHRLSRLQFCTALLNHPTHPWEKEVGKAGWLLLCTSYQTPVIAMRQTKASASYKNNQLISYSDGKLNTNKASWGDMIHHFLIYSKDLLQTKPF